MHVRAIVVTLSLALLVTSGCADGGGGGDRGPGTTMGGGDAGRAPTPTPTPTPTPPPAGTCDYGSMPAAQTVSGGFAILGGPEMVAVPAPTGGDPAGVWVAQGMTVYLPDFARGQVDETMSTLTGTGWFAFEAGRFRFKVDVDINVVTSIVGTITQASGGGATGTYAMEGNELVFAPECTEMGDTGDLMGEISRRNGFSRTGDTGTLVVELESMIGTATLVVQLRKVG